MQNWQPDAMREFREIPNKIYNTKVEREKWPWRKIIITDEMPWTFWQRIKQKIGTFFFLLVITAPNKPLGLNYMGGGGKRDKTHRCRYVIWFEIEDKVTDIIKECRKKAPKENEKKKKGMTSWGHLFAVNCTKYLDSILHKSDIKAIRENGFFFSIFSLYFSSVPNKAERYNYIKKKSAEK